MHDAATLAFYDREAVAYAARDHLEARSVPLDRFLDALPPGAAILELGCGGGYDGVARDWLICQAVKP
jgi:hypothetical protein